MLLEGSVVEIAGRFSLALLLLSMVLALIRLIRGPAAADRIVALDLISMLIVAFLAVYSVFAGDLNK